MVLFCVINAWRYHCRMPIQSFKCPDTQALFGRRRVTRWVNIESAARRKLEQLHMAGQPGDLLVPPGNRLEKLVNDREGRWSIRINDQWRVCFVWTEQGPGKVEIIDYH